MDVEEEVDILFELQRQVEGCEGEEICLYFYLMTKNHVIHIYFCFNMEYAYVTCRCVTQTIFSFMFVARTFPSFLSSVFLMRGACCRRHAAAGCVRDLTIEDDG